MMRGVLTIFLLSSFITSINAQKINESIGFFARNYADSIVLRWVPGKAAIWEHAKIDGYEISKAIYKEESDEEIEGMNFTPINASPVTRWSEEKFQSYAESLDPEFLEREEELAIFAYGFSYPEREEDAKLMHMRNIFQDDLNTLRDEKSKQEQRFLMAMLPCEQSKIAAEMTGYRINDSDVSPNTTYIYRIQLVSPHPVYDVMPAYLKVKTGPFNPDIYKRQVYLKEGHQELAFSWEDIPFVSAYHVDKSLDGRTYYRITDNPIGNVSAPNYQGRSFTSYEDDSLEIGKTYYYKFYALTPFADEIEFGYVEGTPKDLRPPPRPFIDSLEHVEREIMRIHWSLENFEEEEIRGFIIGRADSDTTEFFKIHEGIIPREMGSFKDIHFDENVSNYYKLGVLDMADNISYSDSRLFVFKDEYPPDPPVPISGIMDSTGLVTITLESQKEKDFMGYRVYKSNANYHEYSVFKETWNDSTLLNPKDSIIMDSTILETLTEFIYYKVTALDYNYNESFFSDSIKVVRPDIIPPVAPVISDYDVLDESVELQLTLSSSEDVVQNYIYRRTEGDEKWQLLDSLVGSSSVFIDSTVQVQKAYEYVARAIDDANLLSEYSNRLRVKTYFKPRPVKMDIECQYFEKNKMTLVTWELKENISESLIFSISSDDNYIGRTTEGKSNVYAFDSKSFELNLKMKGETPTKTYLSNEASCSTTSKDVEKNKDYRTFKNEYGN